jgi:hypothetical protein
MVKPCSSLASAGLLGLLLLACCSNDAERGGQRVRVDCDVLYRLPESPDANCVPPAVDGTRQGPAELERAEKDTQGVRARVLPAR